MSLQKILFISLLPALLFLGCKEKKPPILNEKEAISLIKSYLKSPAYPKSVMFDKKTYQSDVIGLYKEYQIAIKYGEKAQQIFPYLSKEIDYYISIPKGDETFIRSAMTSLNDVTFLPVLAQEKNLGSFDFFEEIKGTFTIRHSSQVDCAIDDNQSNLFTLLENADAYTLPHPLPFIKKEGIHTINCYLYEENHASYRELEVAQFTLLAPNKPQYIGGLHDKIRCAPGYPLTLNAKFSTPKGTTLEKIEYRIDKQYLLESNVVDCETLGTYTYKAIARDSRGVEGESPEMTFTAEEIPDDFFR